MTTDLSILAWAAVWCVALAFPYTLAAIAKVGPARVMGYPQPGDDVLPPWARRAKRAHLNMVENLAPFVVAVLVVHVVGAANATTALGAEIFLAARLVMAAAQIFAIPYVRSLAWFASLAGLGMILYRVL